MLRRATGRSLLALLLGGVAALAPAAPALGADGGPGGKPALKFDSQFVLTLTNSDNGTGSFTYDLTDEVPLKGDGGSLDGSADETFKEFSGAFKSKPAYCSGPHPWKVTPVNGVGVGMDVKMPTDSQGKPEHLFLNPGLPNENYIFWGSCAEASQQQANVAAWLGGWSQFHQGTPVGDSGDGCRYDLEPGMERGKNGTLLKGEFTKSGTTDAHRESNCLGPYSGYPYPVWIFDGTFKLTETTKVAVKCKPKNVKEGPGYDKLTDEMKSHLKNLYEALDKESACYRMTSGYRDKDKQQDLYDEWHDRADGHEGDPGYTGPDCPKLKPKFAQCVKEWKKDGTAKGGPCNPKGGHCRHVAGEAADITVTFPPKYNKDLDKYRAAAHSAGLCGPPPSDAVHVELPWQKKGEKAARCHFG